MQRLARNALLRIAIAIAIALSCPGSGGMTFAQGASVEIAAVTVTEVGCEHVNRSLGDHGGSPSGHDGTGHCQISSVLLPSTEALTFLSLWAIVTSPDMADISSIAFAFDRPPRMSVSKV